jgi:bifunctional enzyme CysN/CysC
MVTGASTADLAVILIDARKGVLTQTRRHSYRLADRHPQVVLAVNKMDLVGYSQKVFDASSRLPRVRAQIGLTDITSIPLSGLGRQHLVASANTPWYHGPTLMGTWNRSRSTRTPRSRSACRCSGSTGPTSTSAASPASDRQRQRQARATHRARAAVGQGEPVARIVTMDGDLPLAVAGQSVTLTLGRRDRHLARRRARRSPTRPPRWPTSSRPRSSGCRRADAAGPPYLMKIGRRPSPRPSPSQVQGQRQHAGAPGRQALGSTRSASCNIAARPPIAFDPTRPTATPAASS